MCQYKQLSIEEREKLYLLRGLGKGIREIGRELERHPSTISRELKRGHGKGHPYTPHRAQVRYERRRKNCGRPKILADPKKKRQIRMYIEDLHWSPEQISNRLKEEVNNLQLSWITIYRAINSGIFDGPNAKNGHKRKKDYFPCKLRRKGKKYRKDGTPRKQGRFAIDHTIEERPEMANRRLAVGHYEADTVVGKQGKALLITAVDRCSRYTLASKVASQHSELVKEQIIRMLSALPIEYVSTMTPDRGSEFAKYREVTEALPHVTFYFASPHSPWERATNENTNGLIREFLPKGQDMTDISEETVQDFVKLLNLRPRKCLGWKTPYEVFWGKVLHLT